MPSASPKKRKSIQNAILKCGTQRENIRSFAQELVEGFSDMDPSGEEKLLDTFITELVLSAAHQRIRVERLERQMEGIAAAKARGVRFGRQPKKLPDDFDEYRQAWQDGEISLREAAESCGMGRATFHRAVLRQEQGQSTP